MSSPVHELLERHYRPRRQFRMAGWIVSAGLFLVGVVFTLSMLIFGIDEVPRYVCTPSDRNYAACAKAYRARSDEFAESRAILSLIPLGTFALFLLTWWPIRNKDDTPLWRLYRDRREDVVWIYPKKTTVRRRGSIVRTIHAVAIGSVDRKRRELVMREDEVAPAIKLLASEAPHATVGYDAERERQFLSQPASLRKAPSAGAPPRPEPSPVVARAPQASVPVAPQAAPPPSTQAPAPTRLIVAPTVAFGHIDHALRRMGFAPGPVVPGPAGEPATASWSGHGARVDYRGDPTIGLRVLDLSAHDAGGLRNHLVGGLGLPLMGSSEVHGLLGAPDPRHVVLGLWASEALGVGPDRAGFQAAAGRLQAHPDPSIAHAAREVARRLG